MNEFNASCVSLRVRFQEMTAGMVEQTTQQSSTAAPAERDRDSAMGVGMGRGGSASASGSASAPSRAKKDSEEVLQGTLQTIMGGRLLRER